ncbi:MAG: ATP synthase F1 subunit epsilon [Rhodospirillaceae bacterium]|nr:ATP synthase F1 subunit epsilon [Rhodospirillaceae bacterium]
MDDKIELDIVTPVKLLLSTVVDMVVVPGGEGDFGVLAGHAPMIANVRPGTLDIYAADKITDQVFVEGGIAEITAERCTVLAEMAVLIKDIDPVMVDQRLEKAEAAQAADPDHVDGKDTDELIAARAMKAALKAA